MKGGEDMGGLDPELEAILAKDDTAIMLDELRELFGADIDGDSRFTVAQIMTAMERSFENGKAFIQMLHEAERKAAVHAPPSLSPGVGCEHTPGPWQFFPSVSAERSGVIDTAIGVDSTNGTIIAEVARGKQFEANARLIATAPDMFEALRRIAEMTDIEADFDGFEAREIAIAALARAKGDRA
jgi:hypothetical protein